MLLNKERMQRKMDEEGLDGLITTTRGNFYYLTGVSSDGLRSFIYEHQAYALVTRDRLDETVVVESQGLSNQSLDGFSTIKDVITYGKFYRPGPFLDVELSPWEKKLQAMGEKPGMSDALSALAAGVKQLGLAGKKVGIDDLNLKVGDLETLQGLLPGTEFVPAGRLFRWVRKVKTAEEIRRMKAVNRIVENAITAAMGIAREGVTEYEMAREFDRSIVSQGALPEFTLIHFGRNAVAGERQPKRTPLTKGEPIWFDCGCCYNGYWADLARVGSLGEPSPRARSVYQAVLEGENQALLSTKAGMTGEDIFNLTMEATRKAGLTHYQRHHVGHGIGLELYEDVRIAPGVKEIVEDGTIVNIETPYYEFGLGALHVEDAFVVRAAGNELLTTLSRELLVVE